MPSTMPLKAFVIWYSYVVPGTVRLPGSNVVLLMVKTAEAIGLLLYPLAAAMDMIVPEEATGIAAVYLVDEVVGVLPSVV